MIWKPNVPDDVTLGSLLRFEDIGLVLARCGWGVQNFRAGMVL
jgi:hypothetical protein